MTTNRTLSCLAAALLLAGCSVDRLPGVYRIDVQQGNVVTQEMLDQLRPGMNREQVRFVMGTPMIVDTFHDDRWDYYFSFRPGNGEQESQLVTLRFEGDRLTRVDGAVAPLTNGVAATGGTRTVAVTGPLPDSRGLLDRVWDSLTDWGDDDDTPGDEPKPEAKAAVPEQDVQQPGPGNIIR